MRRIIISLVLLTAVACSDGTAPNAGTFDRERVREGIAIVERAANSKALSSLHAITRFVGDVGAASASSSLGWSGELETVARKLGASAVDAGTALIPVMRASVLGKTFVFDPGAKKYVVDAARTGAPSSGVRFILYEVDPNENPVPGQEIGHADLTDERRSSTSTAGIRLEVVLGGVTQLTYSFDLSGSVERAEFAVFGYVKDGSDRLDFSIKTSQQLFARGGAAMLEAKLYVAQEDFEVTAKLAGTAGEENADGSVDLTIRSKLDEIIVDAETVEGVLDATFTVNGQLLATANGDPKAPVVRGAGGRALSDEEVQVLHGIVEMAGGIFAFVSALLAPAGVLLLVALGIGG